MSSPPRTIHPPRLPIKFGGKIKTSSGTSSKRKRKLAAHEPVCLGSSWGRGTNKTVGGEGGNKPR